MLMGCRAIAALGTILQQSAACSQCDLLVVTHLNVKLVHVTSPVVVK